jgi:Ca-activated chloride channel family protein
MRIQIALLTTISFGLVLAACSGRADQKVGHDSVSALEIPPPPEENQPYFNPSVEEYNKIHENSFMDVASSPISTFSADVDRASYSNVKRFIESGSLPPADAVRIEELVNYFSYNYPQPTGADPYSLTAEVTSCPWAPGHQLALFGLQAKSIPTDNLPPSNLVFLIDVSGSMSDPNKLPLVKSSLTLLTQQLREQDKVAIVVYAGAAGLVLPSTSGANKGDIVAALDKLESGGSTAGAAGIELAYKVAAENFKPNGNNRVILCTDGDFNVGVSNENDLETLIEKKRETGIFLTCLGYGMGNYKDNKMETLADKGNGNYAYVNDLMEAKKTLVNEFGGTLFTVAKDVKLQVEFNPAKVKSYRLIGYENRMLKTEDFTNDKKDAGEMGAGHTVTAIYEIIPAESGKPATSQLKYQSSSLTDAANGNEILTLRTRYKQPTDSVSKEIALPVNTSKGEFAQASENLRWASSVAMFGMLLRNSEHKGSITWEMLESTAKASKGADDEGYRSDFIRMAGLAKELAAMKQAEGK